MPRRRWRERRYNSYSFTTSALGGGQWSVSRPGRALTPGKGPPVTIVQEAGWVPEPVWKQRLEEKSFRLCRESNLDRPVFQPVTRLTELPGSHSIPSLPVHPISILIVKFTYRRCRVVSTSDSYSKGSGFKYLPADRLYLFSDVRKQWKS
jgi:hypothetical protein